MPLYEYQCTTCNERHEIIQRFSDAPVTVCPTCGGEMKKLISSPAIQFKGSGFYKTDYSSSSSSPAGASGGGSARNSSSSDDAKADSKSESKTESKPESKSETKAEPAPAAKSESKS